LRPAPGETGARDAVPLFGSHQSNWVLHTSNSSMNTGRENRHGSNTDKKQNNLRRHPARRNYPLQQVGAGAVVQDDLF
jgi:hypothetical protein